jgi:hypothetical protein
VSPLAAREQFINAICFGCHARPPASLITGRLFLLVRSVFDLDQILSGSAIISNHYGYLALFAFLMWRAFAIGAPALCKLIFGHFAADAGPVPENMSASVIFNNHRNLHWRY